MIAVAQWLLLLLMQVCFYLEKQQVKLSPQVRTLPGPEA
jgi:hypothetical protein